MALNKPAYLRKPRVASVGAQSVSLSDLAFQQPVDPRRRPEMVDSQMIEEDNRAIANLPMRAIHKQFTPGKYSPHYWMESEIYPVGAVRYNEPDEPENE